MKRKFIKQFFELLETMLSERKLQTVTINRIEQKVDKIMADLTVLQAQVTKSTEVVASAVVLINGIAAKLESMKNDPAQIQALADELRTDNESLAAAVAANTPAEPPVPESLRKR